MKKVLIIAAVGEVATGLALMIAPSLVGRLLLGEELTGIAIPVARVAGIALIALGVACWPGPPRAGMIVYSATITLYLAYVGFAGGLSGMKKCESDAKKTCAADTNEKKLSGAAKNSHMKKCVGDAVGT